MLVSGGGDCGLRSAAGRQQLARPLEVLGRIDAKRHALDDLHIDPHAGFERAQLLELLALLQRRGRQRCDGSAAASASKIRSEPDT